MIKKIEQWIDQINMQYASHRVSCSQFSDAFQGFYSADFLAQAYVITLENIPKPDFQELREMGMNDFIDMPVNGITYKNTYYILPEKVNNMRLHFHELVHVAQWKLLGAEQFIQRYIYEIQSCGYEQAPLEKMAYGLDAHFSNGGNKFDVPGFVSENL